jgi:hypothetical protein
VAGIPLEVPGIAPRVVNTELYEMSAPPGKRGGAVSGAGPCALVSSAQNSATSNKDIRTNRSADDGFCAGTTFPPVQIAIPKHIKASSREPTGGQTRCEVVREQERKESAERGTVSQSRRQANLNSEIRRAVTISRVQEESRKGYTRKRDVQKERASLAWICSNPAHHGRVTSTALSCSTALLDRRSSRRRNQMRRL